MIAGGLFISLPYTIRQPNGQVVKSLRLSLGTALLRDRDGAYGKVFHKRLSAMGIRDRPVTPRSPWQNGYVERVIGSIRRDLLDHVIAMGEAHLRRLRRAYADYHNTWRTPLGLDKDTPFGRPVHVRSTITPMPKLGGLHHAYVRI